MKRLRQTTLILLAVIVTLLGGRVQTSGKSLTSRKLLDTIERFIAEDRYDTIVILGAQLIDAPIAENDPEEQKTLIEAINNVALAYYQLSDYRRSYELSIRALDLCERWGHVEYNSRILTNIGNVYYRFGRADIARQYDLKALKACRDSVMMVGILNNLGDNSPDPDSVWIYLNRALDISRRHKQAYRSDILLNLALYYQKRGEFDVALRHFRMAYDEAQLRGNVESEAENLHFRAKLFREQGRTDSALHYIARSNALAKESNIVRIQVDNYLSLSEIEERRGRNTVAFEYFKVYARLRDSILNNEIFGDINRLQHLYEASKANRRIEQLTVDRLINRRTIVYQMLIIVVLVVACVVVFLQKRKLDRAYKTLVEKSIRIFEIEEKNPENFLKGYKRSLDEEAQQKLMNHILAVMEDTSTICDTEFSLEKLSKLVHSNHAYVSQTINATSGMNFRSFLIGYRIREAQRLFSKPDNAKYTIEAVAGMVGFKSRTAFREAFKEITGVGPAFYIRSLHEGR